MGSKVAIGYMGPNQIDHFFHASLISLIQNHPDPLDILDIWLGPRPDMGRNQICERFLDQTEADKLLMVDTDMVLQPETIQRLDACDKDIVSALCFEGATPADVQPAVRKFGQKPDGSFGLGVWAQYPKGALARVEAVGAACLMIKRRVLESMRRIGGELTEDAPWFRFGYMESPIMAEDIGFCLWAQDVGFEVWCDFGLMIPHVKPRWVEEKDFRP